VPLRTLPRWSPVAMTGNTAQPAAIAAGGCRRAAMEPGRDDREHARMPDRKRSLTRPRWSPR